MKKREGTALALYPVKERLQVFAPVLDKLRHSRARNAGASAHLSKYIRQVSEQAKDKLVRLQRACDNRAKQGLSRDWPCDLRPIQ